MDNSNYKNPSFLKDLLFFSIIFVLVFAGSRYFSIKSNDRQSKEISEKEENIRVTTINREYQILSTKFLEPQKVTRILSNGLVLESGTVIRFMPAGAGNVSSNMDKFDRFDKYGYSVLIGNSVSVVLPEEDFFLNKFMADNMSEIYADVYFDGEYINEKFGFMGIDDLNLYFNFPISYDE